MEALGGEPAQAAQRLVEGAKKEFVCDLNAFFLLTDEPEVYSLPQKPVLPQERVGRGYLASAITALALTGAAAISIWRGRKD